MMPILIIIVIIFIIIFIGGLIWAVIEDYKDIDRKK